MVLISAVPEGVLAQSVTELLQQAQVAKDAGQFQQAEQLLRQVITQEPGNGLAYRDLCEVLDDLQQAQAAVVACRQAVKLAPQNARAWFFLGYVEQEPELKIAAFQKAIALDPKSAIPYNELGNALRGQKKLDEAIAAYQKAIALDPKSAVTYYNLGSALRGQNKLDEAIAAFRKALSLPDNTSGTPTAHTLAHNNLGLLLQDQGKREEAKREFEAAIKIDPKFEFSRNNLEAIRKLLNEPVVLALTDTRYLSPTDPLLAPSGLWFCSPPSTPPRAEAMRARGL